MAEALEAARLALLLELCAQTDTLIEASAPVSEPDLTARFDAIDNRLRRLTEETLPPIALSAAEARAALRPARAVWRWRGRG